MLMATASSFLTPPSLPVGLPIPLPLASSGTRLTRLSQTPAINLIPSSSSLVWGWHGTFTGMVKPSFGVDGANIAVMILGTTHLLRSDLPSTPPRYPTQPL